MSPSFGLFCNPESRRVEGFCSAIGRLLRQRPVLIPWLAVLENQPWENRAEAAQLLRLESPGRNWRVERQLLVWGAESEDEEADREWRFAEADKIAMLEEEPGRIHPMRQWFLGWRRVLRAVASWAGARGLGHNWLCPPEEVICMFDKAACQQLFESSLVPVPPSLGLPGNFDELWESMRRAGRRRVFLKPCHGSSASGVVAIESAKDQIQAFSTVELNAGPNGHRLYNRRRIHTWRGAAEVRQLVDALCRERCLAQVWVPKAGLQGQPFDLRVVVIGGRARQVMVRLGRGPITNSQLLGGKGDCEALRSRMGDEAWQRMLAMCERALSVCFPGSLYAGFDVLIEPDYRTSRILEVNAFGDLLPWILHEDRDTYEWEVMEALRRRSGPDLRNVNAAIKHADAA